MRKKFNFTGYCNPKKHYMVDLTERLEKIKAMIDEGEYFVINWARQYGKTMTLKALARNLTMEYIVFPISFEGLGESDYVEKRAFCLAICDLMQEALQYLQKHKQEIVDVWM